MSDPNYGPRQDLAQSQSSRYDHYKAKSHREQKEYPRDTKRRNEQQANGDRVRTGPIHENEYHSPEKRATQDRRHHMQDQVRDRPPEDKSRDGKEASRERHHEDRRRQQRHAEDRRDKANESRDGHRADRSRQQRYLEDRYLDREEGSHDRHREERSRDKVEVNRYKGEGTQNRYWEERSPDKHWEKSSSHERDRYLGEKSHSIPPNLQEMNFHQESSYYKRDVLPMGYAPPPRSPAFDEREYYESEPEGGILDCNKCRYLCTGRGVLQILEVVLCALVLICVISSYFVLSGLSSSFASGGLGNMNFPFEGQELQQVRQLDQQFTVMRAPLMYGGLAFSVVMGALTFGVLAAGSKRPQDLSWKWLLLEAAFSMFASLGCGAAIGVFLHFALQINATEVCKKRARLYARNGLTWMNCDLAGTDGAAATFAVLLVIFYFASLVLAIRCFRERTQYSDHTESPAAVDVEAVFPKQHVIASG